MVDLILPYAPTINHYFERNRNGRLRIGQAGLDFRVLVWRAFRASGAETFTGPISISIAAVMPDRKVRDIGNLEKCTSDALQHAGVMVNDYQVRELRLWSAGVKAPGALYVRIKNSFESFSLSDVLPNFQKSP